MTQKKKSVYASIADDIISKISGGVYAVGTLLPPEREFMTIYSVERTTIRRGLDILKKSGYIKKIAGLGSMVVSAEGGMIDASEEEFVSPAPSKKDGGEKKQFGFFCPENSGSKFIDAYLSCLRKKAAFKSGAQGCSVLAVESDAEGVEDSKLCFGLSASDDARSVILDSDHASRLAIGHLIEKGHTEFAFIGCDSRYDYEWSLYNSYATNLNLSSLGANAEYIKLSSIDEKSAFDAFSELIRRHSGKFSAVIVVGDEATSGVLKAAKYYRLSVPEDISVINICTNNKNPETDSVYFDVDALAEETIHSLSRTACPSTVLFKGRLIDKGTTSENTSASKDASRMSDFLL